MDLCLTSSYETVVIVRCSQGFALWPVSFQSVFIVAALPKDALPVAVPIVKSKTDGSLGTESTNPRNPRNPRTDRTDRSDKSDRS
jgi:hypothetical protein